MSAMRTMRTMRRSLRLFWLPAIFLIAACDYLLTDPIQPTGTIELQFQIVSGQLGTTPQAFAKVEQVYIQLTVPDSVPSVFHNSVPFPSVAAKNSSLLKTVR